MFPLKLGNFYTSLVKPILQSLLKGYKIDLNFMGSF